jgi:hypothetical protein
MEKTLHSSLGGGATRALLPPTHFCASTGVLLPVELTVLHGGRKNEPIEPSFVRLIASMRSKHKLLASWRGRLVESAGRSYRRLVLTWRHGGAQAPTRAGTVREATTAVTCGFRVAEIPWRILAFCGPGGSASCSAACMWQLAMLLPLFSFECMTILTELNTMNCS